MVDEERLFVATFLSNIHFQEIIALISPWDRCVMQDTTHFRIDHLVVELHNVIIVSRR